MSTATVAAAPVRVRAVGLDRARGLAIVLMLGDHLALLGGVDVYRVSLGRAAMPLFFVLAGHLAGRLRWRHAGIALVGVALPLAVPWIDSPNVLVLWACGCVCLWLLRRASCAPWVLVLVALTLAANGWLIPSGSGYHPAAMVALMGVGAMLPRSSWGWADRLPAGLEVLGRHPVAWYVGHLLVLQAAVLLWLS